MTTHELRENRVREARVARGWSQAELAQRAGISREGISAIEGHRLSPSVAAALALASALECSVEELFGSANRRQPLRWDWAWKPPARSCRYWAAEVDGNGWLIPAENDVHVGYKHDGVGTDSQIPPKSLHDLACRTLVVAGCDPAAGLLAQEYERQTGFRMIVLVRSSQTAMDLVAEGKVHVAGVHWSDAADQQGNAGALQRLGLNFDLTLLHLVDWEEGLALRSDLRVRNARQVAQSRLRWIGRLAGAGARRYQDQILGQRKPPARTAHDHRGVVEAIRAGWADVGACVRLASEEGRLQFLPIGKARYDYCVPRPLAEDPRLIALKNVLRSPAYRSILLDLPGYDPAHCGEAQTVAANPV